VSWLLAWLLSSLLLGLALGAVFKWADGGDDERDERAGPEVTWQAWLVLLALALPLLAILARPDEDEDGEQ
jgi:hypothetical protein